MRINKKISNYNSESRQGWKVKYIVIHYVGAVSTAKNNADYFYNTNTLLTAYGGASAHFFVDESSVWQSVDTDRAAWHCGGPLQGPNGHTFFSYCTNLNSIGIEMCVVKRQGRYYIKKETVENTAWLVQKLMKQFNVSKEHVIRHYDVTGKECPDAYPEYDPNDWLLNSAAWERFRNKLTGTDIPSKITLTGANYPETLTKGERFVIKGKVKSAVKLKSVTVVVERESTGKDISFCTYKRYTSAKTFDLSRIDPYISFRKLSVGNYRYKVKAEDINGTAVTLLRRPFKVKKGRV